MLFLLLLLCQGILGAFTTITVTRTLIIEKVELDGPVITTRRIPDGRGGFIEGQLIPPVSAVILDDSLRGPPVSAQ